MKRLLVAATWCLLACACGRTIPSDGRIAVVPRPVSVVETEGVFRLAPGVVVACEAGDAVCGRAVAALDEVLRPIFGLGAAVRASGDGQEAQVFVVRDSALGPEAYRLTVAPECVRIEAGGPAGAFYAVQTLRQLIPAAALGAGNAAAVELPCATIEDAPRMGYRGAMLDVCRHFFTVEEVKAMLDLMALHKLNVFHWHLTDDQGWRIAIDRYPELTRGGSVRRRTLIGRDPGGEYDETCRYDETPHGGFYTKEQIRDVVAYAAERGITVIPEIEFPGHAVAALASCPWLSCTGEQYEVRQTWDIDDRVFCPGKETTFEFIEGVLAEVLELFPSEYIHIGGDECPMTFWQKCPHCAARMRSEGLTEWRQLQNYATARVERFLNAHGRRLIGWDEILEGDVTPTATIMSWRGAAGGVRAARQGNRAIMSPSEYCYLDYYQSEDRDAEPLAWGGYVSVAKSYSFDPFADLTPEQQRCIIGVQGNLWTEYIADWAHAQYMLLPRLAALAEVAWSPAGGAYDDFRGRMERMRREYDACGFRYAEHMFGE